MRLILPSFIAAVIQSKGSGVSLSMYIYSIYIVSITDFILLVNYNYSLVKFLGDLQNICQLLAPFIDMASLASDFV